MFNVKKRTSFIWKIVINTMLLFFPIFLIGQAEVVHLHRLSVEQNLSSQTYNWYVFKDSEGFIWISSINGLNRFDGKEVVQYHPDTDDSLSLAGPNIQSKFFEDINKNLWFSTNEAIHKYNRKNNNFQRFFFEKNDSILQGNHQILYLDTLKQNLWVRIGDRLFISSFNETKDSSTFICNICCKRSLGWYVATNLAYCGVWIYTTDM